MTPKKCCILSIVLSFGFKLQEFGEDLVNILDTLRVKYVIGIGHGAGANIMMRFGMVHLLSIENKDNLIIVINLNKTNTGYDSKI